MLANLLGGFIILITGTALMPTVTSSIAGAKDNLTALNSSSINAPLLDLVTTFYALGIMSVSVAVAVNGLYQAGLI